MNKFEVICIDMFQTLVNIESRKEYIWKRILKDNYTKELENKYVEIVKRNIVEKFHKVESLASEFHTLREIFENNFNEVFKETNSSYCPINSADIFIDEHRNASIYTDSEEFIRKVKAKYPICLVSDADKDMIEPFLEIFKFDRVYISEEIQAYKHNSSGKMFEYIIKDYNVSPEKILHIGDSSSDIIGAHRMGIKTCWINRHNYKKRFDIKPDYEVTSLMELLSLLE